MYSKVMDDACRRVSLSSLDYCMQFPTWVGPGLWMPVIVAFCFVPLPFLVVIRRTDLCIRRIPGCNRRSFLVFCPFAFFFFFFPVLTLEWGLTP